MVLISKTHFCLGRVDVDVHQPGIDRKVHERYRVSVFREEVSVTLPDGGGDLAGEYASSVDAERDL